MNKRQAKIPEELIELLQKISKLPPDQRDQLLPLASKVMQYTKIHSRLYQLAQEKIAELELQIKWLQFGLQATERERNATARKLRNVLRRRRED